MRAIHAPPAGGEAGQADAELLLEQKRQERLRLAPHPQQALFDAYVVIKGLPQAIKVPAIVCVKGVHGVDWDG